MLAARNPSRTRPVGLLLLFAYGSAFHFLLLRLYVLLNYSPPADRDFVDHWLVNCGTAFFGGAYLALCMTPLLRSAEKKVDQNVSAALTRCGLLGAVLGSVASVLALQTILVCAGIALAITAHSAVPGGSFADAFLLAMLGIETYGILAILWWIPFAVVNGAVLGILINHLQHRLTEAVQAPRG